MAKIRVHIGHHFFGSGNIGDDLMLAGFLAAAEKTGWLADATLTCCSPHDRDSQRLRFPTVEWLPYEDEVRQRCIGECDVWLGLGDTPFQISVGPWFLDHLCQEASWCAGARRPMYFLGIGVNEPQALLWPQAHHVLAAAERVWTRDPASQAFLRDAAPEPGRIAPAADLAHLALETLVFPEPDADMVGFVLNFEDPSQYRLAALGQTLLLCDRAHRRSVWLAQEIRPLAGAEVTLHEGLPAEAQTLAPLCVPDYRDAPDAGALLAAWGAPGRLLTSRYHATLTGAWAGWRTVAFARSAKVAGGADQCGVPRLKDLHDPETTFAALESAKPADRVRLRDAAALARRGCDEFFNAAARWSHRSRPDGGAR